MPRDPGRTLKRQALRRQGVLNPRSQDVQHELFQNSNFFDPEDLVQVKYEMLRQVGIDQQSISASAEAFGFSRPSFYQAQSAFQQAGLAGLLPEKRGPRSGHKLTAEVMEFISRVQTADALLSLAQLAQAVQEQFGLSVHPRSIDRQLRRQKKQRRSCLQPPP
jgi:transposase